MHSRWQTCHHTLYANEQGELAQTARENIEGDLALKIDKTSITSELGNSEVLVMSQKAVTDELYLKTQNIPSADQGKSKYFSIPDRADDFVYSPQYASVWSKFGFWSFATAKADTVIDEILVPLYSLGQLTGDLRLKVFIAGVLAADLTKPNAQLGVTTLTGYRAEFVLPKRLAIKSGQQIVFGWEMSNSDLIQLIHKTIEVDANYPFGLNQAISGITDGSVISATVPPATPTSGLWFLPIYCRSYKIYDTSNPNGFVEGAEFYTHKTNPVHELVLNPSSNVLNTATSIPDKFIDIEGVYQHLMLLVCGPLLSLLIGGQTLKLVLGKTGYYILIFL